MSYTKQPKEKECICCGSKKIFNGKEYIDCPYCSKGDKDLDYQKRLELTIVEYLEDEDSN